MTEYVYDIEVLKNLFTATFINVADENDIRVYIVGLGRDQSDVLKSFLRNEMTLIGYNNISYDDPMLRFLMGYKGNDMNRDLYTFSGKLINDSFVQDKLVTQMRYPRNTYYAWNSVDLMAILDFGKLGISLKQTAINLKWHRIQDLPVRHDEKVTESQLEMILDYNKNDVLITKKLYEEITPLRELRKKLSALYHVNLNSASDSRMANLILEDIYANELRMDMNSVRELRTPREKVLLGDCIAKFIEFKSNELKALYDRISSRYVYKYSYFRYSENIWFAGCNFSLGIGGLHTEDAPGVFESDDKYIIQDMDVASYYPNLIINNNFFPKHLGLNFIKVLKKITSDRIEAKRSGDKVKADGLKITVNSIFGKMGSEYFWLLDPKAMLSTTISGQLGLLMLVEDLHANGITILSCNTDGIVCKIPRDKEAIYYEVAKRWEEKSSLQLEYTPYRKYVRRDVNSYITEKFDGSTKEKGAFLKEVDLKKSYHMPIVAKALYAYYMKGVPVRTTLENCKDIMEFCISQKTGSNFVTELHTINGIETLQKTNRFYISKKGGSLLKRDYTTKKLTGLYVGKMVRILNNYDKTTPFEDYQVDLAFYEKEVQKIVDEIEPKQMSLFDMSDVGGSVITQTDFEIPVKEKEEDITISGLNKLGKNQFIQAIEHIVLNYKIIKGISPRYIFILEIDPKELKAHVYCLSKGKAQYIRVNKDAYKKQKMEKGQLVYCDYFEKTPEGHSIAAYHIADKLAPEVPTFL